jgi:transposase
MKRRFCKHVYKQRVHVESSFSQDKRVLGSALRSRSEARRMQECLLRVLTHDLMILRSAS